MSKAKQGAVLVGAIIVTFMFIIAVEFIVYERYVSHLEESSQQVAIGWNKAEVLNLMGSPDNVITNARGETLNWSGREHQGKFLKFLGLSTVKGHYEISISFSAENRVEKISKGIN